MTIRIFVSSTSDDLKDTCRKIAIGVIDRKKPHAEAVAMEKWNDTYIDAVAMCDRKIREESSHYIGIFAYRRGWVPTNLPEISGKSITEAEYDWALQYKKLLYILMPNPCEKFAQQLFVNSIEGQTEEDDEAQAAFRRRVKNGGFCRQFDNLEEFKKYIQDRVNRWIKDPDGPLDGTASAVDVPPSPPATAGTPRIPNKNYFEVDRETQHRQFDGVMGDMHRNKSCAGACFLVYGPDHFGHTELIDNLCFGSIYLPASLPLIRIHCDSWLGTNHISGLIQMIGSEINGRSDTAPVTSILQLAELLKDKKLKTQDVVIRIGSVHSFDGGILEFSAQFWQPLIQALGDRIGDGIDHRVVLFVTANDPALKDCDHLLQDLRSSSGKLEFAKLLKLDRLTSFTNEDVEAWLTANFPGKPKHDVAAKADEIIREAGAIPKQVYDMLKQIQEGLN